MNKKQIEIVIADDNVFLSEALKDSLNRHQELLVKATVNNLDVLKEYIKIYNFDILILDVNFDGINSLDYISDLRKNNDNFKIIVLTTLNNNFIRQQAIENNIDCFVGKDTDFSKFKDKIIDCFYETNNTNNKLKQKRILVNNLVFTKRKLEILQALYIHSDKTEKEIATILNLKESSIKSHKRDLFEITNTKNTTELIKFGIKKGLIIC